MLSTTRWPALFFRLAWLVIPFYLGSAADATEGRLVSYGSVHDRFLCESDFWGDGSGWIESKGLFEILEVSEVIEPGTAPYPNALYAVKARCATLLNAAWPEEKPAVGDEFLLLFPAFRERKRCGPSLKKGVRIEVLFFSEKRASPNILNAQTCNDLTDFDLPVFYGRPLASPSSEKAVSIRNPLPSANAMPFHSLAEVRQDTLQRLRDYRLAEFGTLVWDEVLGDLERWDKALKQIPAGGGYEAVAQKGFRSLLEEDQARVLERYDGHLFWTKQMAAVYLPRVPAAADDPAYTFTDHLQAIAKQFESHGIAFIYIPIPNKIKYAFRHLHEDGGKLNRAKMSLIWQRNIEDLLERGVDVIDLSPAMFQWLADHPDGDLYLRDHHLSFLHADFLSKKAAESILLACPNLARTTTLTLVSREVEFSYKRQEANAPILPHLVERMAVQRAETQAPFELDPESPVIVFGDSNVNKGFPEYISFYLQHAVARGGRWLFDKQGATVTIPAGAFFGKKVVVYVSMADRTGCWGERFLKTERIPEKAFAAGGGLTGERHPRIDIEPEARGR